MSMILRIFFCLVFSGAALYRAAPAQDGTIRSYFPAAGDLKEWHQEDSIRVFTGEDLFLLIDGGADIYLEYGFQRTAVVEYRDAREQSIKLEIYEMTDAPAAYGMYSLNANVRGRKIQIGNEGMLSDYYLMFWKNRFLVYITGADTTRETTSGILAIAASVDQRLGSAGVKPKLMSFLPSSGLLSCTYIRGSLGLSSYYTFDTKNIFRIKEGAVGIYPAYQLFLFQYPSDTEAMKTYLNAQGILQSNGRYSDFRETAKRSTMTDQKGAQLCVTYYENLIAAVISKHTNDAAAICDDVITTLHNR